MTVALPAFSCLKCAVLIDISGGTSYQTVRLVFRPYTTFYSWICTSQWSTTSSCLSSAFIATWHSSQVYRVACTCLLLLLSLSGFYSIPLAMYVLSLVRVSRRVRLLGSSYNFTFSYYSTFCHHTCSLSVSTYYLALDDFYHPLQRALPSTPTLSRVYS